MLKPKGQRLEQRWNKRSTLNHKVVIEDIENMCKLRCILQVFAEPRILELALNVVNSLRSAGCYCFRDGAELAQECEALIRRGETQLSQALPGS